MAQARGIFSALFLVGISSSLAGQALGAGPGDKAPAEDATKAQTRTAMTAADRPYLPRLS
jgi:hypothetical protein